MRLPSLAATLRQSLPALLMLLALGACRQEPSSGEAPAPKPAAPALADVPAEKPEEHLPKDQLIPCKGHLVKGVTVYAAASGFLVGTVAAIEKNHVFPDMPESPAILLQYPDGSSAPDTWMPIEPAWGMLMVNPNDPALKQAADQPRM